MALENVEGLVFGDLVVRAALGLALVQWVPAIVYQVGAEILRLKTKLESASPIDYSFNRVLLVSLEEERMARFFHHREYECLEIFGIGREKDWRKLKKKNKIRKILTLIYFKSSDLLYLIVV